MTSEVNLPVELTRHCVATTVPGGDLVTLPAGARVTIVQSLGGSITVCTARGALVRVDGSDADALGLEPAGRTVMLVGSGPFTMEQVTEALRTVYDPEIPVNVVELGLIYRCDEVQRPDGTRLISIDMSMTAPGCGMGDVLRADAARVVARLPGVDDVEVSLVWDPPWSFSRMSDAARLQVGLL
jgi:probable FeS assembly SUF system protein SufT